MGTTSPAKHPRRTITVNGDVTAAIAQMTEPMRGVMESLSKSIDVGHVFGGLDKLRPIAEQMAAQQSKMFEPFANSPVIKAQMAQLTEAMNVPIASSSILADAAARISFGEVFAVAYASTGVDNLKNILDDTMTNTGMDDVLGDVGRSLVEAASSWYPTSTLASLNSIFDQLDLADASARASTLSAVVFPAYVHVITDGEWGAVATADDGSDPNPLVGMVDCVLGPKRELVAKWAGYRTTLIERLGQRRTSAVDVAQLLVALVTAYLTYKGLELMAGQQSTTEIHLHFGSCE